MSSSPIHPHFLVNLFSLPLSIGNTDANDDCFSHSDYDAPQHFNQY